mmetsp:Transcript_65872/g.208476  ORF Transcript_65872/g.208476 Transcript_65872/m.208476 type:complete len:422 (+) Transcript_65872:59-1324(+)
MSWRVRWMRCSVSPTGESTAQLPSAPPSALPPYPAGEGGHGGHVRPPELVQQLVVGAMELEVGWEVLLLGHLGLADLKHLHHIRLGHDGVGGPDQHRLVVHEVHGHAVEFVLVVERPRLPRVDFDHQGAVPGGGPAGQELVVGLGEHILPFAAPGLPICQHAHHDDAVTVRPQEGIQRCDLHEGQLGTVALELGNAVRVGALHVVLEFLAEGGEHGVVVEQVLDQPGAREAALVGPRRGLLLALLGTVQALRAPVEAAQPVLRELYVLDHLLELGVLDALECDAHGPQPRAHGDLAVRPRLGEHLGLLADPLDVQDVLALVPPHHLVEVVVLASQHLPAVKHVLDLAVREGESDALPVHEADLEELIGLEYNGLLGEARPPLGLEHVTRLVAEAEALHGRDQLGLPARKAHRAHPPVVEVC